MALTTDGSKTEVLVSTRRASKALQWLTIIATLLVSAELTARIEDYLRLGIPLSATPDREHDLVLHDELGIRGRPHGVYKKWRLNNLGFRGPDVAESSTPGCTRILVLGASETFGLYESAGKEFPAQLADQLKPNGCYEVLNAAVAGLTVRGLQRLWTNWASRFGAQIVVIYPTPGFYLANSAPAYPGAPPATDPGPPAWVPRLLERAKDVIEIPEFIQNRRVARQMARSTRDEPGWMFEGIPQDRLTQFEGDLEKLVASIKDSGAIPLVLSHANAFGEKVLPSDQDALEGWRQFTPRAAPEVILGFEAEAARVAIDVARRQGAPAVDVSRVMSGRREWFADAIHFTDDGAREIAALVSKRILQR